MDALVDTLNRLWIRHEIDGTKARITDGKVMSFNKLSRVECSVSNQKEFGVFILLLIEW